MSLTSTIARPLIAALALSLGTAAMAETIVVKSAGPSAKAYPPGKSIADNSKVSLKSGDSVTILDGRGTRILKGPGVFATTATTATGSNFNALLRNTGTRQVRTGAVRGMGIGTPVTRPPNVWLVDATKSGTVCVADTDAASVWVPAHEAPLKLMITRVSDGRSSAIEFHQLQTVRSWPSAELPIRNGDQFRISGGGMTNPATIRMVTLGPNPQGLERTASALITAGCSAQLDLLIETVSAPAAADGPAG